MVMWALDSGSPNLTLPCFSPLIKGSDHFRLHFLRVIFFLGEGTRERQYKRQNLLYKCFWKWKLPHFCCGIASDKNKFKLLDQKRIQESHGIQGHDGAKDWTEKMGNGLIGSSWVMCPPLSQSAVSGKLGMKSTCCHQGLFLSVGRVTFKGDG